MARIAIATWDDVRKRMTEAGCAPPALDIVRCLQESGQKFYGYGSRFNGENPNATKPESDWDFAVVCPMEVWCNLFCRACRIVPILFKWCCGGNLCQPVFSNFPDKGMCPSDLDTRSQVDVRRIESLEWLVVREPDGSWRQSDWTEIDGTIREG
jgi:hypothetical protein